MADPSITIVLPTHDGARYLDQSIGSVVAQSLTNWELLVVDDASTDDTAVRIQSWMEKDERIRAIHLNRNLGLPAALNAGFRIARGRYLTWTSDDNWYRPNALSEMRGEIERAPHADIVYAGYTEIDAAGAALREVPARSPDGLVTGNRIGACFLYRREVDAALGGYDEAMLLAEDYDFWLRASTRFTMRPIAMSLYGYRRHAHSLSATHTAKVETAAQRALDHHLESLERKPRGRALVSLAIHEFAQRHSARGRRTLARAIGCGRIPLWHAGFRWVMLDALLGRLLAKRVRGLSGRATD